MAKIYKATLWRSGESAKPLEVAFTGDETEAENAAHTYFNREAEAFYSAELISFESGKEDTATYHRTHEMHDDSLDEIEELVEGGSDYDAGPLWQYSD